MTLFPSQMTFFQVWIGTSQKTWSWRVSKSFLLKSKSILFFFIADLPKTFLFHFRICMKDQPLQRNKPKTPTTVVQGPLPLLPRIFLILKICPKLSFSNMHVKTLIYLPYLRNSRKATAPRSSTPRLLSASKSNSRSKLGILGEKKSTWMAPL